MDKLICNKCFSPIYRGKQPYSITSCGHIFCQDCLPQVENECPQCKYVGAMSIPLTQPLSSKVTPFFEPLAETLETLLKVVIFRNNQTEITMQRFRDLDMKYQRLKSMAWMMQQNLKTLSEKYAKLKAEKEEIEKKMLFFEMRKRTPRSNSSMNSGIFAQTSSTGYSTPFESPFLKTSLKVTPMQIDPKTPGTKINKEQHKLIKREQHKIINGFLVPNRRPPKSNCSFTTVPSDAHSNSSFMSS